MGYDSRDDYYRMRYDHNGRILPQDDLDSAMETDAGIISAILDDLRATPLASRLVVFGSVSRGCFMPGDVDVAIDLRSGPPAVVRDLNGFLRIARKHYGWLDVFLIEQDGNLLVRNENATAWTKAKNALGLKAAIASEGRPLSDVTYELDPTPVIYDPVPWEVDRFRTRWASLLADGLRPDVLAHWQRRHLVDTASHPYPEVNDLFDEFASTVPDALSDGIDRQDTGRPSPSP